MSALEAELAQLFVDALNLETAAADIDPDAPLFGEGLGLDSIDALEIALAVHSKFGVKTVANDEKNREYYHSIASLAEFVRTKQAEGGEADNGTAQPAGA